MGIPTKFTARSLFEKAFFLLLEVFTKLACNEASLTVREAIIGRELQSTRIPRVIGEVDEEAAGFLALGSKKNRDFSRNARRKSEKDRDSIDRDQL